MLPLAWTVQWIARGHPELVERAYSRTLYPLIQGFVGTLTGWFGWSLVELILVLIVLALIVRFVRGFRKLRRGVRSFRNLTAHFISWVLAFSGLVYGWGILGWGLNYHRQPFALSANFDTRRPDARELRRLCETLSVEAASLRDTMPEDGDRVTRLSETPRQALQRAAMAFDNVGRDYTVLQGASLSRPKALLIPLLPWLHISGIFVMHTSEPNVNMHQPPFGVLSAGCHELAHQLGWAREEEASFVGFAACRRHPDPDYRYSTMQSALRLSWIALQRADRNAANEVLATIHPGVLRDWNAATAFWDRFRGPLSSAAETVNDTYLKSQGQAAGVESYGMMVELLVGDLRERDRRRNQSLDSQASQP